MISFLFIGPRQIEFSRIKYPYKLAKIHRIHKDAGRSEEVWGELAKMIQMRKLNCFEIKRGNC